MGQESYALLGEVFAKQGFKWIATEMKLSPQCIQKWTVPPGLEHDGRKNPLDRCAELYRVTQDERITQWVCTQAGGIFVPLSAVRPASLNQVEAASKVEVQLARALIAVASTPTGGMNALKAQALRELWNRSQSATESYVRACELGWYDN